jgi:hypothetical protein
MRLLSQMIVNKPMRSLTPFYGLQQRHVSVNTAGLKSPRQQQWQSISLDCSVSEGTPFDTAGSVRSGHVFCGVYEVGFAEPFVTGMR